MKTQVLVLMIALITNLTVHLRAQPPGLLNFAEAPPPVVLDFYREASGLQLVTSSHVSKMSARITIQPAGTVEKAEMLKLVEKALLEQAGIVITKLDDKRASVTYNDALPVKRITDVKPLTPPIGPDGKPIALPPPPGARPIRK